MNLFREKLNVKRLSRRTFICLIYLAWRFQVYVLSSLGRKLSCNSKRCRSSETRWGTCGQRYSPLNFTLNLHEAVPPPPWRNSLRRGYGYKQAEIYSEVRVVRIPFFFGNRWSFFFQFRFSPFRRFEYEEKKNKDVSVKSMLFFFSCLLGNLRLYQVPIFLTAD